MTQMNSELRLNQVMRSLLHSMVEAIDEGQLYEQLPGGGNSPAWILGHLSVVNRFGHSMLGGPGPSPADLVKFGPGSSPALDLADGPSKQQLLEEEQDSAEALRAAVQVVEAEILDAPQQSPFLQKEFPLVRNMLAHILASHLSLHIGQLSAWRRAHGMPSILKI